MQHTEPLAVERSLAVYLWLVRAYPPAFREQYGDEMARAFRDTARAAWRRAGLAGLIALWAQTLTDTLANATKERVFDSGKGEAISRWSAFLVKQLTKVAIFGAGVGTWRLSRHWLPTIPPANRGWAVLVWAAILGLLLAYSARDSEAGFGWRPWVRWTGAFGWMLWALTSMSLGLDGLGIVLPAVFIGMLAGRDTFLVSPEKRPTPIGGKDHWFIAIPALLLLLAPSGSTPVATNVFLAFVVVINGIAAFVPRIEPKTHNGDAGDD